MSDLLTPPTASPESTVVAAPSALKRSNQLGLIALILAGLGFVVAVIPVTAGFAWLLTLPALILGIVGVTRRGQKKGTSIAAIVLSTVAWLIAVVITAAIIFSGMSTAVDEAQDDSGIVAEEPVLKDPAAEAPVTEEPAAEAPAAEEAAEPALTLAQQNAIKSGRSYLEFMGFSRPGLISQLEYEGYTTEEAGLAADTIAPDWNAEAAESAKSYLDTMAFSRQELLDQLLYEKFTPEQAEFGVAAVGY